jgi:hypothetical protein
MSGYLQRLVQTAARPAATVHPFAASILAAARNDQARSFESVETIGAEPETSSSFASRISQRGSQPESPRSRRSAEYRPIAPTNPPSPDELQRGQPTGLSYEGEVSVVHPSKAFAVSEAELESAEPSARLLPERSFRPLMPNSLVAAKTGMEAAPSRKNSHDSGSARGSSARSSEGDDIQIHIGRIEITAVRPPASPAPKGQDSSFSLDDYLNRRAR